MNLAALCDTSGNYIGEIEMGRRIPSFEKIEKIARALKVSPHQLFMQNADGPQKRTAKAVLAEIPPGIKKEIKSRLMAAVQNSIDASLDSD